jgi:hypothetical protein
MDKGVRGALMRFYGLDGEEPMLMRDACKDAVVAIKEVRGVVWEVVKEGKAAG